MGSCIRGLRGRGVTLTSRRRVLLWGMLVVFLTCIGCIHPEKLAQQQADYRAAFERQCLIELTETGKAQAKGSLHEFPPGTRVELYVRYLCREEHVEFKIEREDGTSIPISARLVMPFVPGTRKLRPPPGMPSFYMYGSTGLRSPSLNIYDWPNQYSGRNLPEQPWVPMPSGFAHCYAVFNCPTETGNYLVVLSSSDRPGLERSKTYPFSVSSQRSSEGVSGKPVK
jgi:hypothetical protein